MDKKKKWLNVVDKRTYLYLLAVPVGLLSLIRAIYLKQVDFGIFSACIIFIGIYLFIKDNTYSEWMNPKHPH